MLKLIQSALLAAALFVPVATMAQEAAPAAPAAAEKAKADAPKEKCCDKEGAKCDKKAKCDKDAKCDKKCAKEACKNAYVAKVSGMMCAACEAKVTAAFKAVDGVKSVKACHKGGVVCVVMEDKKELTKEAAEKALAALKDFKVAGVDKCEAKKCDDKKCDDKKCDDKKAKKCCVKKPAAKKDEVKAEADKK